MVGGGREDGGGVEALVLPEGPVLGVRGRVEEQGRDLLEGNDPPVLRLEAAQLDGPRPVIDDGRLRERQVLEQRPGRAGSA